MLSHTIKGRARIQTLALWIYSPLSLPLCYTKDASLLFFNRPLLSICVCSLLLPLVLQLTCFLFLLCANLGLQAAAWKRTVTMGL